MEFELNRFGGGQHALESRSSLGKEWGEEGNVGFPLGTYETVSQLTSGVLKKAFQM